MPPIYEDDVPDEPVGLFNEFGATDPQGLPIEEVFNEPEVVVPAVVPAVAGPKWVDIPILDAREAVIGRRGAVVETMIPKFLGRSAGHQNIPADIMRNKRPIDFFFIFLSDDILTRFCNATNDYAAMIESKSWGELTIPEFKVFICLIVFKGIVKLPERVTYWQKGQFGQQFPQKLMSARRFEQILSHWHWILVEEDDRAARKAANPFYLVDGFVERLARNCQHYWKLDQFMDIDEMFIYYKGRHKCRCYNPNNLKSGISRPSVSTTDRLVTSGTITCTWELLKSGNRGGLRQLIPSRNLLNLSQHSITRPRNTSCTQIIGIQALR